MRHHLSSQTSPCSVDTGRVLTGREGSLLTVQALGSCIAVTAVSPRYRCGGIAHLMLPGAAPAEIPQAQSLRYAENGIHMLLQQLRRYGVEPADLSLILCGGGNVLMRESDTICADNIESVREITGRMGLAVVASSLGGYSRRRILLDLTVFRVLCWVGDASPVVLWSN